MQNMCTSYHSVLVAFFENKTTSTASANPWPLGTRRQSHPLPQIGDLGGRLRCRSTNTWAAKLNWWEAFVTSKGMRVQRHLDIFLLYNLCEHDMHFRFDPTCLRGSSSQTLKVCLCTRALAHAAHLSAWWCLLWQTCGQKWLPRSLSQDFVTLYSFRWWCFDNLKQPTY